MRIVITEQQAELYGLIHLVNERIYNEFVVLEESGGKKRVLKDWVKRLLMKGVKVATILAMLYGTYNLSDAQKKAIHDFVFGVESELVQDAEEEKVDVKSQEWTLAADDVLATVYNAVPAQCNKDVCHTASMFRLNLDDVFSHRIIAMERTFMAELGLKYGDVVKIEGTGTYDGVWQIQDTMNKRFAGKHKIDLLVPRNVRTGMWKDIKLYVLGDKSRTAQYKADMAPQMKKR